MYPMIRFAKVIWQAKRQPKIGVLDPHISQHMCLPWDIDPWMELNNGRTLTLFDLGRLGFGERVGLHAMLKKTGWGMAVAGAAVRYRRRVRAFDRFTTITRVVGWDEKFFYIDHTMWRRGECTGQALLRNAVTSDKGIIKPRLALEAMGQPVESPPLPQWIQTWVEAEDNRPWPPEAGKLL